MTTLSREAPRAAAGLAAATLLALGAGCGSTKVTGTPRTGTEQLLLTNAWDKALQKVDFRALTGVPVYLDTANVTAIDQGWVVSSLREAMLTQGVLIREKREQAQFIVEARVGAYGTDDDSFLVGIPQTTIPPTVTGIPTGSIPEIPLIKRSRQQAVAKLAIFAYDRASGQLVWQSGTSSTRPTPRTSSSGGSARSSRARSRKGPRSSGSRSPPARRVRAPTTPTPGPPPEEARPYNPPALQTPSNLSDLDSFQP